MNTYKKDQDRLNRAVRQRRERREYWRKEGERSLAANLSLMGALGGLVVVPTLIGLFVGRWLDQRYGTGIFWTASLLFLGVVLGSALAWRRMNRA
jgi:ATP synthase protein I